MAPLFPDLVEKLQRQYTVALEAGDLVFTDSETVTHEESGIPFQIRFAPALAKKPTKSDNDAKKDDKKPADPFAAPYPTPSLFVVESDATQLDEGEPAHAVLLNKFCVVPRHFLLVTKEFARQNTLLTPQDLVASYDILFSIAKARKEPEHLGFYNCGDVSGASQPHKHLQFIPLPDGRSPLADAIDAHRPQKPGDVFFLPMLPFANFVTCLPPRLPSVARSDLASLLISRYLSLLDALTDHSRHLLSLPTPPPDVASKISETSYNFLFTEDYMMIVPRTRETARIGAGHEVSVNSLGFAGMLLVKTREELDAVKEEGVLAAMKQVSYPLLPSDYAVGEEPA